jgi:hypothetical protein
LIYIEQPDALPPLQQAAMGRKTLSEAERYTASADQERMAREAISKLIFAQS